MSPVANGSGQSAAVDGGLDSRLNASNRVQENARVSLPAAVGLLALNDGRIAAAPYSFGFGDLKKNPSMQPMPMPTLYSASTGLSSGGRS